MDNENDVYVLIVVKNEKDATGCNLENNMDETSEQLVVKEEYDLGLKEINTIFQPSGHENLISSNIAISNTHKQKIKIDETTYCEEQSYIPDTNGFIKTEFNEENLILLNSFEKTNKVAVGTGKELQTVFKKDEDIAQVLDTKISIELSSHNKSFVGKLRSYYPELENDEELLIFTLANIMKEIRIPPTPPEDFCIDNGVEFKCAYCEKLTSTLWLAQRHYQEHHGPRYLICFACGSDFRFVASLYKHEKRCSSEDAVIVLKARALIIAENGRNRPFLDEKKRLEERKNSKQLRKNTKPDNVNSRKWPCAECCARFSSERALQVHTLCHSGRREFACDRCPSAFTTKSFLKKHIQIVHLRENYICDICQKEFKRKPNLIIHLNTHLAEKKHLCPQCGRGYTKKIDLEVHINIKHLNMSKPHPCKMCDRSFSRFSSLNTHMKNDHGLQIITRKAFLSKPHLSQEELRSVKLVFKPTGNSEMFQTMPQHRNVPENIMQ